MEYIAICLTSLVVSIITLFSGFGLSTVLTPVFALFFPLHTAIGATAVVHLANNLFRAFLVGKLAKWRVVYLFGIPAALASALGAGTLLSVVERDPLYYYTIGMHAFKITPLGLTVGSVIVLTALFEVIPKLSELVIPARYIPLGGALSGFFGGFSGNQGVFRAAVLIKAGLTKEEFIATSVICTVLVDAVRVGIYNWTLFSESFFLSDNIGGIVAAASLTSFLGSYIGSILIKKATLTTIRIIVACMLLTMGAAIALGFI